MKRTAAADLISRSNFTDYRKNLGYSYANPYPDEAAANADYRLTNHGNPGMAIAADLNSGRGWEIPQRQPRKMRGQNAALCRWPRNLAAIAVLWGQ